MHTLALILALVTQEVTLVTQEGHAPVHGFAISPNGQYVATAGDDTAKLYRRDGVLLRTLGPNDGEAKSVAFSPDSETLAVGTKNGVVVWSIQGERLKTLEGVRTCSCRAVAFIAQGREVLCLSDFSGAFVWTRDGALRFRVEGAGRTMALSPDGGTLVVTNKDAALVWVRLSDGKEVGRTKRATPMSKVTEMIFVGADLVTAQHGPDAEALQLRDASGRIKKTLFKPAGRGKSGGVFGLHAHPDGKRYGAFDNRYSKGDQDPRMPHAQYRDWLLEGTKSGVRGKGHRVGDAIRTGTMGGSRIEQAAWFPKGRDRLVLAEGVLYRMDDTGGVQRAYGSRSENVRAARARAKGGWVVGHENGVSVWSPSGRMERAWSVPFGPVFDVGVTRDDKYVVTTGLYGWEVRTIDGNYLHGVSASKTNATKLHSLSMDGRFMALSDLDKHVSVRWLLPTKDKSPEGYGSQVAFLPDGGYLTSNKVASKEPAWKVTRYNVTRYDGAGGHNAVGVGVEHALVHNGVPLFTTWAGNDLRVHAPDGKVLSTLRSHPKGQLMLTPDGKRVVTLFDSEVTVHEVSGKLLLRFSVGDKLSRSAAPDERGIGSDYREVSQDGRYFKLFGDVWSLADGRRVVSRIKRYGQAFVFGGPGQLLRSQHDGPDLEVTNLESQQAVHLLATGGEWVAYTPDGYYDSSPAGGRRVMMVRGVEAFAVDQFAARINRPDILLERLGAGPPEAIEFYRHLYQRRLKKLGLSEESLDLHAPDAQITGTKVSGGSLQLKAACVDDRQPLRRYNVYVNDVPLFGAGKPIKGQRVQTTDKLELTAGTNRVEVSCTNDQAVESFRAVQTFESKRKDAAALWVLAFGVSDYQDDRLDLQFAHKDAADLSVALSQAGGFTQTHVHTFTDAEVTPDSIRAAKARLSKARPTDTLVVFIAGHGVHGQDKDATWYYLTHGARIEDLSGTAARFEDIEELLNGVAPRKKLFLMDACESGEAEEGVQVAAMDPDQGVAARGIRRKAASSAAEQPMIYAEHRPWLFETDRFIYNDLARRSGAIVFSSSRGGELSYESTALKNGFFTHYLLEALLSPNADADGDGEVTTSELRTYVSGAVARVSSGRQHPTVDRDNLSARFGFQVPKRTGSKASAP